MTELSHVINHIRNRSYMSGVEREKVRIKATGEVFTPTEVAQRMLDTMDQSIFNDVNKTILDNSCGDVQLISEALIRKMENGSTFEQALSTTYGVDLMQDNVDLCRERLLCGREDLRHIVEKNIYQADALKFSYEFKPMSNTRRNRETNLRTKAKRQANDAKNAQEAKDRLDKLLIDKLKLKKAQA